MPTESSTDDGRPYIRAPPYIRPRSRSCSTTGKLRCDLLVVSLLTGDQESSTGEEDAKPAKHVGGKRVADEDIQHDINKRRKVDPKASDDSDITTTEDDTDNESYAIDSKNQPRPSFPNAPKPMGPHVLDKAAKIYIPNAMNRFLRPYQREGVEFFFRQYKIGRGGVLGDDMGLGKTIQVIAFLSAIMDKSGLKGDRERRHRHVARLQERANWRSDMPPANATWPTCLVAAPTSVVGNWEREFEKWGYFEVGVYSTALKKSERADMLRDFKLGRLDVLIVSHALLRRDIDQFDELALSVIFLDEAHLIKRKDAGLTQAMNRFNCQCRFALTGTLIQNSYMEMWAVLDFTNPKQLGHKRHWNRFIAKPLIKGQSASASAEERQRQDEVAEILTKVILPKFFLRRTKDLIKHQLPNKTDEVVFCPLAPLQRKVYKRVLRLPEVQNLIHKDDPCPSCNSGKPRKSCCHAFEPETLFIFMHVLIALANHLALLLPGPNDSQEQVQRYTSLTERVMMGIYADENKRHKITYSTAIMRGDMCGKWKILRGLLAEWRTEGTNKVLIFTKSIKLLEMLEFQLKADSYEFRKLEGSTPQKDRMGYIDEFNNDPSVFAFLISTLAGGTGINLTGANKVVIFDPNWNPAHDLQAMDRAFRFGQTRDVSVYRLLGGGSLEELVYARQLYKQQQMAIGYDASAQTRYFDGVQGDPQKQGELFGIKNMFTYHEDEQTTKMAIERATIAELDFALGQPSAPKTKGKKSSLGRDEAADLRGLGAFMFDDLGGAKRRTQTAEQRILSAGGVKYSHRNDELVKGAPRKSTGTSPTKVPI
ncbi:P-loop containing nucleoside triphosphate hydrolase protein [Schizophyllum amplum]|uniref:P-loop containing nucleoside triphosphate hydrolase protein n=1 Tax=Schizophyllum amplum TaxID=97359 RepID=A0A550C5I4_9AGAR|nr:P-loop containing nucleoside triphosphate hydrolase protein [Auriculariopsis ampla]